jgi:hypothetical protein
LISNSFISSVSSIFHPPRAFLLLVYHFWARMFLG